MADIRTETAAAGFDSAAIRKPANDRSDRPRPWRHVRAIVACPGVFAVLLPGVILTALEVAAWMWPGLDGAATHPAPRWPGFVLMLPGLVLFVSTNILFHRAKGTLHPDDGPTELVTGGLYAWMRNPMIVGVFLFLGGMSVLLGSWPLAIYLAAFAVVKNLYIALHEEFALTEKFGEQYQRYVRQTPLRWLPWPPRSTA